MAQGSDNLQPLGICHRFFNFIINNLIGKGLNRVTLGQARTVSNESVQVPIEGSTRNLKGSINPSSKSNGEVIVEFMHLDKEENRNPVQDFSSSVHFPKKNGSKNGLIENDAGFQGPSGKDPPEVKHPAANHETGPKVVAIKETAGNNRGKDKNNQEKSIPIHQRTTSGNEAGGTITIPQRPFRPLLMSVASNINEKADAFIRSRKEAMSKHYGLEPKKS